MRSIKCLLIGMASLVWFAGAASANYYGHRGGVDPVLADLMKCYAQGTDAIGDRSANPTQAGAAAAGLAIYNKCFKPDAEFLVWFPGTPWSDRVDPDPNLNPPTVPPIIGPGGWADFVAAAFRDRGEEPPFDYTQHLTDVWKTKVLSRGKRLRYGFGYGLSKTAQVVAYLHASHVITLESVLVATGTYTLHAEWYKGKWMIKSLKLTLLNFDPFFVD